jgi:hypothetical protein
MVKALKDPATAEVIVKAGFDITPSNPSELADFVKLEIVKWAKVVKDSGAKGGVDFGHECSPARQHAHPGADRREPRHRPCDGEEVQRRRLAGDHRVAPALQRALPVAGRRQEPRADRPCRARRRQRGIEEIRARLGGGRLDALVNNAAISPKDETGGRFGAIDTPFDLWRRVFNVNFFAPVALPRGLMGELSEARGCVVNVTSIAGSRVIRSPARPTPPRRRRSPR